METELGKKEMWNLVPSLCMTSYIALTKYFYLFIYGACKIRALLSIFLLSLKKTPKLKHNSSAQTTAWCLQEGKEGGGVKEGIGGINGDGRRLDLGR